MTTSEATPTRSRIFISYRREDSEIWVGRLADELRKHFPPQQLFQDVASIDPGADFRTVLEEALATAAAMLVVIGPRWLSATDKQGRKRLENPADLVRQEVAESLGRPGVRVFPLLVDRAEMPIEEDLPEPLKPLTGREAFELTARHWTNDVAKLVELLKRVPGLATPHAVKEAVPGRAAPLAAKEKASGRAAPLAAKEKVPQGMTGADIFICYSRKDRELADRLLERLHAEGWSVWMDKHLRTGTKWRKEIQKELAAARSVVVLWSAVAVKSDYVMDVAWYARERGIFVPALIETMPVPFAFRSVQTTSLVGWHGQDDHAGLQDLLDALRELLGETSAPDAARLRH